MRRFFRRLAIVVGVVLALTVILVLAAPLLLSGDRLRDELVARVTEATGAEVSIADVGVTVLPRLAVRLSGGEISGTGEALAAAQGTDPGIESYRLELKQIDVRVALAPLLRRELQVTSVVVEAPEIAVVQTEQDVLIRDLRLQLTDFVLPELDAAAPAADAPPGARIPPDLVCHAALRAGALEAGGVVLTDLLAAVEVDGPLITVESFAADYGGGRLSGEATLDYERDPWGELTFSAQATDVPLAALLAAGEEPVPWHAEGTLAAEVGGRCRLEDAETARTSMDLTGTITGGAATLTSAPETTTDGGEPVPPTVIRWSGLTHAFRVTGTTYEAQGAEVTDLVVDQGEGRAVRAERVEVVTVGPGISLDTPPGEELALPAFRAQAPTLTVVQPAQEIVLRQVVLDVQDVRLDPAPREPVPADAPPGEKIPADLRARSELRAETLELQGLVYDDLAVVAHLDRRLVTVPQILAQRAGGRLAGQATVDYRQDPWGEMTFDFTGSEVPAAALLAVWSPPLAERLESMVGASGRGRCRLENADVAMASLDLEGTATTGTGVLHASDWLGDIRPYLGQRQDLVDVRFRSITHDFAIEQGRYQVRDLEIDGLDTHWRGSGSVGLDGTMDLGFTVKLPAGFTPDLGQWSFVADAIRDEDGRVNLDLHITGQAAKPTVAVDLSRLKAAVQQTIQDEAEEGVEEALKEGLGGLLDKLKRK